MTLTAKGMFKKIQAHNEKNRAIYYWNCRKEQVPCLETQYL